MTAWAELCMLPKAVLRPPPRGGAHRQLQTCAFTQRRCARWLEGERHELWEINRRGAARRFRPSSADSDDDTDESLDTGRQARCMALAAEGELSRACASLVDPLLLEKKAVVLAALRAKHPTAAPARPSLLGSGPCPAGSTPDFSVEDVVRAARSFRCGSAAGPSGLRGEHLREALDSAHGDEVAAHLTRVVQLLARGETPPGVGPAPRRRHSARPAQRGRRCPTHCCGGNPPAPGGQVSVLSSESRSSCLVGSPADWRGGPTWV